jgi:hypothetical protein
MKCQVRALSLYVVQVADTVEPDSTQFARNHKMEPFLGCDDGASVFITLTCQALRLNY